MKKITVFTLALCFAFLAAGCSQDSASGSATAAAAESASSVSAEETAAPVSDTLTVTCANGFHSAGITGYQCTEGGTFQLTALGDSAADWSVFLFDRQFDADFLYFPRSLTPALKGEGTFEAKEGQYVYVSCSVNGFTAEEADPDVNCEIYNADTGKVGLVVLEAPEKEKRTEVSALPEAAPTVEELHALMDLNFACMQNIFSLASLPHEGEGESLEDIDRDLRRVTDPRFPTYADFESYIRDIYCREAADRLLYNYPYEGTKKYENVDGQLYLNLRYDGGKGYYVDTKNYTVLPGSLDGTTYTFTVETTVEVPADKPTEEKYTIYCTALYENGVWLLGNMFS